MACRVLLVLALLCVSNFVRATELLCRGSGYAQKTELDVSALIVLDVADDTISIKTFNGWAKGTLGTDPEIYMGVLTTASGIRYWYNLNRYTGAAVWGFYVEGGRGMDSLEFNGKCSKAKPQF